MPINFGKPVTTGNYSTDVLQPIQDAITALARWLDPATAGTLTGTPTGAYRINAGEVEKFDGTSWLDTPINGLHQDTTSSVVGNATKFTTRVGSSSVAPALQAVGTGSGTSSMLGARFSSDASGPLNFLSKSRSGTLGSHGLVLDADVLGTWSAGGSDGAKIVEGVRIEGLVDGTAATDAMPARINFRTNGGSSSTPSIRLSIDSAGAVEPGADNTQALGSASLRWATVRAVSFIGALTGNASTATTLATPRTINGVSFNGSANITVADATKLPLSGGTLTGLLTLSGAPSSSLHAATKAYVDARLPLAGGTMTGALVMQARAYTEASVVSFSATPTFNAALSNFFRFGTLTANVTSMTISNPVEGQMITIRFKQNSAGGKTVALPAGAVVSGSINAGANKYSYLNLTYNVTEARFEGSWLQVA